MRIMMVITGMQTGGAERVMATLCNELSKRNEVTLLVMKKGVSDYYLSEKVSLVAGNIDRQSLYKCVRFTKNEMIRRKPDVVLSFMTKSNIIAILAALKAKMADRVVIAERANPYNAKLLFKVLRRFLYPRAGGAVFQTEKAQRYYERIIKYDSVVLKNPLNPDFDIKEFRGDRRKTIVTIGRLSEAKNQKLLIEAFSIIAHKIPEYTVEIYGDGPLREMLQKRIDESGLKNRIQLMGRKETISDYVKDAGIFVLPSNSEGMPNALIEAMAMGIPSIATDCPIGGTAAIIDDHVNGLLIPMNNPEKLSEAIMTLIRNEDLSQTISKNAIRVTRDFSAVIVCGEWEQYLQKVSGGCNEYKKSN